jgi:Gnt-I system high-affinity gluconate transporter
MSFFILIGCIIGLVLLISWVKLNPFLAFLFVSVVAGVLLGIPFHAISKSISKGIGDTLGSIAIVIVLGAMLGKLVADSGAAQRIAGLMQRIFGRNYIVWAMSLTGFIVGIPLYYNVGFVLLVPIIFSVAFRYQLPLVYIGLPMLASLSVMHGFLPPHPSPIALVAQFQADMVTTFVYGMIIAIPAIVIAGPLFSATLKNLSSSVPVIRQSVELPDEQMPGIINSLVSSLLPVIIIAVAMLLTKLDAAPDSSFNNVMQFLSEPNVAMALTIAIATYSLGLHQKKRLSQVMKVYGEAVKDIAMILLIISGAGMLKQILVDSGLSQELASVLSGWQLPPLVLAWIVTAGLRLALGSATIAGLTAAGILYPFTAHTAVDPNLLVLSIGAGSLFCSHVNDTAFWLFKEYFGLSMKDTFRSWTVMETLVSVIGLIGVLIINALV